MLRIAAGTLDQPAPSKSELYQLIRAAKRTCLQSRQAIVNALHSTAINNGVPFAFGVIDDEVEVIIGFDNIQIIVTADSNCRKLQKYFYEALDAPGLHFKTVGPLGDHTQYDAPQIAALT